MPLSRGAFVKHVLPGNSLFTHELMREDADWASEEPRMPDRIVGVRGGMEETALQKARGIWNRHRNVWEVRYESGC